MKSLIQKKSIDVKAYQDVRLVCHPDAKVAWALKWLKADLSDLPEGRTEIRNDSLVIKQIHVNDTAVYICRAQTYQGSVETRVKVTVNPRTGENYIWASISSLVCKALFSISLGNEICEMTKLQRTASERIKGSWTKYSIKRKGGASPLVEIWQRKKHD